MRIFYMHHAQREFGHPPTQNDSISKLGKEEAKVISKIFKEINKDINFKAIYTSPYLRCKQTAQIINKALNVPIIEDCRLNEFESSKTIEGNKVMNESWVDCQNRVTDILQDIVNQYNDEDAVICITSGVNIAPFISLSYNIINSDNVPFLTIVGCCPICFNINKDSFNNTN